MTENVPKANLAAALAKANAEIQNPKFDKENPHFKSRFASLAAVRDAIVPHYAKHGLSVLQDLQNVADGVACFTTILHESGEERTFGPLVIASAKRDGQGTAAAGTYAKRIHLQAIACVVGDDDDDGEAAAGRDTGSKDLKKAAKGVTTVDPRGDEKDRSDFDPKERDRYVSRFLDAFNLDAEDIEIARAVESIHKEISHKHDLYIAVGDGLGSKKTAIRKYLDILKQASKAAA
jgi:hypothetical protein